MHSKIFGASIAVISLAACGGDSKPPAQTPPPSPPVAVVGATPGTTADMSQQGASTNVDIQHGIKSLQAGEYADAKAAFQSALKSTADAPDAHFYLGEVAEKQSDNSTAENEYKSALKLRPDFVDASQNLGALYIDEQKWDDANAVLKPALAKHSQEPSLNLDMALVLASKGDQAGSDAAFKQALTLSPGDPMFMLTYAHWLGAWKQPDAAVEKLRAARPLAKDDVGLLAAIGHEFYVLGAFADCVPTFDRAIQIKDAAELRTERAACKGGAKDEAGAMADLLAAEKEDGNYALAHYYLGLHYAKAKKTKEAITEFETFVKLEPNSPAAAKAKDHLKQLKAGK